jgi:PAS domain S-box-containing protein
LERQLAEAQDAIRELSSTGRDELPGNNFARQRAEELHAIIQTLRDPVMVYDQNGVIYLANASARLAAFLKRRQHRGQVTGQLTYKRKDSTRFSGELSSVFYQDKNGDQRAVAIIRDINERAQFEIALRKRESILAQAGEMAHLGAWDIEFQQHEDLNANPLTWSEEVYRIFGYAPGEVQPSNELFFERVHPDDRVLVREGVAQAIATRQPYIIDHRILRPNGEERIVQEHAEVFFNESGKPSHIVGAVQDITERKHAEQALRESEERFRSLADSMPQLIWTALPDGTVDYYNSRAQEYWGIKQVRATVWEWAPVLHPEDLQATINAWRHSLKTGETYQIEHRVRMAEGSHCWHLSRGIPMRDEKGGIIRWFGTATNIHDLKLAEEQAKIYAERLERSNRELEQFAFIASHDLQEPLRKIEVFGDLLLESSKSLSGRERNYLDRMREAAGRMRDMVDGLLQLSRVTTQGKPFIPVNLSQVISEVLHDLEAQIRRTDGKVEVDESLPAIEGDPLQLRQLMQNLIGNALKYHLPDLPPEVKVYARQRSEKIEIVVEDHGVGFQQEDAERVFQPFQRLVGRSQFEGSGMGLAICRRIVERHRGEIVANSRPAYIPA